MKRINVRFPTSVALALLVAAAMVGCGVDKSSTGPEEGTALEATPAVTLAHADGYAFLTFSPEGLHRAGKLAGDGGKFALIEKKLEGTRAAAEARIADLEALIETTDVAKKAADDADDKVLEDQLKERIELLKDEVEYLEKFRDELVDAEKEIDPEAPDYIKGGEKVDEALEELDKGLAEGLPDVPEALAWRATLVDIRPWFDLRERRTVKPDSDRELKIKKEQQAGSEDDIEVRFKVPKGAVMEEVDIAMTILGDDMASLIIAFEPQGLMFDELAVLKLKIGGDLYEQLPDDLIVNHIYKNEAGYEIEEELDILKLKEKKSSLEIWFYVPGFSRYSMGGGGY